MATQVWGGKYDVFVEEAFLEADLAIAAKKAAAEAAARAAAAAKDGRVFTVSYEPA